MAADNSLVIVIRDLTTGEGIDGLTVKLRHSLNSFATDIYTATPQPGKPGCYEFTDVSSVYRVKLYVNGVEDDTFGGTKGKYPNDTGEIDARHVTKVTDMSGTYYECNGLEFRSAGATTEPNSLIRKSEADARYLLTDAGVEQTVNDIVVFSETARCPNAPTNPDDLVNFTALGEAVSHIIVTPTQFGARVRRVLCNGVEFAGRDYLSTAAALASISGQDDDNRFKIFLDEGLKDSTIGIDNIFYINHSDLIDYCSFIGNGLNTNIVLGGTGSASITRTELLIDNAIVFLGKNDISTARTYNGLRLNNCLVYAWKATTFNNCNMKDCDVVHANTFAPTLTGTGKYTGCSFSGAVTKTAFTGTTPGMVDGYDTNPTMPSDPSLAP